jgi:hypothetical protein
MSQPCLQVMLLLLQALVSAWMRLRLLLLLQALMIWLRP